MLNKYLFFRFPKLKSWLARLTYDMVSTWDKDHYNLFMNYGYAAHNEKGHVIPDLHKDDEPHRYPIQLYHHVAKHVNWTEKDALEVSSGRGGGAHFVMRYFKPRSYKGLDFSSRAIKFCQWRYKLDGLSFHHGNAEELPFEDESFDVVMNVEASLYYPKIERFFQHVVRVLKPGGHFLYTDLRYSEKVEEWKAQLQKIGLKLVKEEEITHNVLRAMELDQERRVWMVRKYIPRIFQKPFYDFTGLDPDAPLERKPHLNDRKYWYFVFQKV
jgi:ubiquinone/menaquinone biosynthesis C-methylase UbiE